MEKEKIQQSFSNKVTWVSFMMCIFVIYIHANNLKNVGLLEAETSFDWILTRFMSNCIGDIAVPFFFILSGFRFFRFDIHEKNSICIVKSKMIRRIRTVLIPYLIWNTLGMLYYVVVTRIPFVLKIMNVPEVVEISGSNIIRGILLHEYYFPFWYLHDLIVLVCLSPIFLKILKIRHLAICVLTIAGIMCCIEFPAYKENVQVYLFRFTSIFFFLLGGFIGCYCREWFEDMTRCNDCYIAVGVLSVSVIVRYVGIPVVESAILLITPLAMWRAANLIRIPRIKWFYKQSFFIYAVHVIPATVIMKILAKISGGGYSAAIAYLVTPWVTLAIIYVMAKILLKVCPKLYFILCGGRG